MFELAPKIVEVGLTRIADQLTANQERKGLKASGKSARSFRVTVAVTGQTISGQLIGANYWYYQEHGRGPGRYAKPSRALVESIRQWIKDKGLTLPAYAVAYNINKYGVKVPNGFNSGGVVSEILNAETVAKQILPDLKQLAFNDIKAEIFKPL